MQRAMRLAGGVVLAGVVLRAAPEFAGVLATPGAELFVLADAAHGATPRLLRKGQQFDGYTILEYRAATETLVLGRDGRTLELRLRGSRILSLPADAEQMRRIAAEEIARQDRWSDRTRFQGPHLFEGDWLVVAHHESEGRIETRVVVFTLAGALKNYLRP